MNLSIIDRLKELGALVDEYMEMVLLKDTSPAFKEAVLYQVKVGGKRIRPALTILSCEAAGGNMEDAIPAAAAIELIHNYSLILDDIIDRGELRRGKPTLRKVYSDVIAILVATHYRESITQAINDTKNSLELHSLLATTIKRLIEGERLDILFEQAGRHEKYLIDHRYRSITLEDYFKMIRYKTAELMRASCLSGAIVANANSSTKRALSEYGLNIGMAFQIIDDLLDIFGEEKVFGKRIGKDIIEHKLGNIVILLSLEEMDTNDRERLLSILRKDIVLEEDLKKAIELIRRTTSKERAYGLAREFIDKAIDNLYRLKRSKARDLLEELALFIIKRKW